MGGVHKEKYIQNRQSI